jgi:hypothetical protein
VSTKKKSSKVEDQGYSGTSAGITISLGNFQTARFDCWLTLPCKSSEASDTFQQSLSFVNERVGGEVQKIVDENNEVKGKVVEGEI